MTGRVLPEESKLFAISDRYFLADDRERIIIASRSTRDAEEYRGNK
jgi:hypothetical protein